MSDPFQYKQDKDLVFSKTMGRPKKDTKGGQRRPQLCGKNSGK